MANEWKYGENGNNIILSEPPKQKLRITGHRIASVLGLNKYQSPFSAWCEITKLVTKPFETNKYIKAGNAIEPKLIDLARKRFPNLMSIEEYYGNNIDKYKYNNFIDDSNIFGGIMDAVGTKDDLKTLTMVVECKTTSKPQLWENNQVPIEYILQGCEYAYLKKLDRVLFICACLKEEDYNHPEKFVPTEENTKLVVKKIKDIIIEMPDGKIISFEEGIEYCKKWWHDYIETGISPEFDEKVDKEYLDIIRTANPGNDNDLDDLCDSAKLLTNELNELKEKYKIDEKEKELKNITDTIKNKLLDLLDDNETKISYKQYKLSGSVSNKFNTTNFKKDNPTLYEKYCEKSITYRLGINKECEE